MLSGFCSPLILLANSLQILVMMVKEARDLVLLCASGPGAVVYSWKGEVLRRP